MTVLRVAVGVHDCSTCCCRCSRLFYELLYVFMTIIRVAVGVHDCSTCCCRCSCLFYVLM